MKNIITTILLASISFSLFAYDQLHFTPTGKFSSFTKTDYSVTSKFGDYFRSVDSKDVHIFDETGLKIETLTYNSKDELSCKIAYKYDTSRNHTSTIFTDATGNIQWTTQIEYQEEGFVKSESEFDADNNLISKSMFKYENSKVTENLYDGEGNLLARTISTVNIDNLPIEVYQYYGDGSLLYHKVYTYLDNNKISSIEDYNENDQLFTKSVFRYDASNFLTEVQIYNSKNILAQRKIFKNDAKGNATRISIYSISDKFGTTVNELQSITEYAYKN